MGLGGGGGQFWDSQGPFISFDNPPPKITSCSVSPSCSHEGPGSGVHFRKKAVCSPVLFFLHTHTHTRTHTHTPARSPLLTDSISPASFPCTAGPLEPSAELVVCALKIACVRRDGWGVLLSFSCLCAGVWIMLGNDILLTQALLLPPMLFPHPVGALAWDWLSMFKASLGVPFKTLIHPLTLRKAVARKGKNHPVSPWGCSGCVEVRTCPHLTPSKEDQSTRCSGPWCLPLPGSGAASAQPLAEAAAQ